jgi:uncharacterized membrane protein YedE/YeeE
MSTNQQSARSELKRKVAIFGIFFVASALLLHFVLPWFNLPAALNTTVNYAVEYPKAVGIIIGIAVVFYAAATVDDYFSR